MKSRLLIGLLALVVTAWAETFPEIKLRDGRVLKEVTVLGYSQSAFMAKWEGGRGTVAYEQLPDGLRPEFEAKRPKEKKQDAPPPRTPVAPKPTSINEGRLQIGNIDAKALERSAGYVTYTWQAEILNGTDRPMEVNATIKFFDKDGFELDHDYGDPAYVRARQRGTVTGRGMITAALWDAATNFKVELNP